MGPPFCTVALMQIFFLDTMGTSERHGRDEYGSRKGHFSRYVCLFGFLPEVEWSPSTNQDNTLILLETAGTIG